MKTDIVFDLTRPNSEYPYHDIAKCSQCGWRGNVSECDTDMEQDGWEGTPYMIHLCPRCEDGGCIDDYSISRKAIKEWIAERPEIQCLKWFHLDTCSALAEIWDKKRYQLFNWSITEEINRKLNEWEMVNGISVFPVHPKFLILGPVEYEELKYATKYLLIVNDNATGDYRRYYRGMEVVRGNSGIQFSMYWINSIDNLFEKETEMMHNMILENYHNEQKAICGL